jgi:putative phage-type endonuclease
MQSGVFNMIIIDVPQGSKDWFEYRKGKISGTMLGDLYSKRGTRKIGFYELIAERLAIEPDDENRMDRGLRLEEEACELFTEKTGKKVDRVGICQHDKYPEIIQSPDGLIKNGKKYTEALEIKCLSPARHIQAVVENKVPVEFEAQVNQYFIVNDDLKTLYMLFYDPRIASVPYHVIEVQRDELPHIEMYLNYQLGQLKEIDEIVERLAF